MIKEILVTGGTGFTGSKLIKKLLEKGYYVRALARKTSKIDDLKKSSVEIVYGDIRDKATVENAVNGCDAVIHLAAAWQNYKFPNSFYYEVNVKGTKNLLDASLKYNVKKFVLCSTGGVLGHISNPPANENSPYNPGDVYQESKMEGEKLALKYFKEKKLDGTVIRPAPTYGIGDKRILKLFKQIKKGRFFMLGKGDICYHLVNVDDLVNGFILALEKEESIGQVYIIGGNECPQLNELVRLIAKVLDVDVKIIHLPFWPVYYISFLCEITCKLFGIKPPIFRRRIDWFRKNRSFDISKAKKELHYEPKIGLEEGLRATGERYKENGNL
ncbi:Nucleoside-diphosphate-sugar epimerase [Methanophagales archaeon]|nr:Nucleoside-diphosphate-sugar epimerase [Methanophagales archaeon]